MPISLPEQFLPFLKKIVFVSQFAIRRKKNAIHHKQEKKKELIEFYSIHFELFIQFNEETS